MVWLGLVIFRAQWLQSLDLCSFSFIASMLRISKETKQRRQQRHEANTSRITYNAVPIASTSHPRAKPSRVRPLIHFSQGRMLTQFHNLSARNAPPNSPEKPDERQTFVDPSEDDNSMVQSWDTEFGTMFESQSMATPSRHRKRHATQWGTWKTKIIPALIDPWLKLRRDTKSLQNPPPVPQIHNCTCHTANAQFLTIRITRFSGKN